MVTFKKYGADITARWRLRHRTLFRQVEGEVDAKGKPKSEPDREGVTEWNEAKLWTFEGQLHLLGFDEEVLTELEGIVRAADNSGDPQAFAEDGPADFADQILQAVKFARSAIREGHADAAARYALNAGQLITLVQIKAEHEPKWLTGKKVSDGGRKSAEIRWYGKAGRDEQIASFVDNEWSELSRVGDPRPRMHAYENAARKFGVSTKTIRRHCTQADRMDK
jgi:hypothetical protein